MTINVAVHDVVELVMCLRASARANLVRVGDTVPECTHLPTGGVLTEAAERI